MAHIDAAILTTAGVALDDRIDEFAEIVQKHYGLSDLGDPGASTEVRGTDRC